VGGAQSEHRLFYLSQPRPRGLACFTAIPNAMPDGPRPQFLQPPVRADGPIRLAGPDPKWAVQYAREEERIQAALGPRAVQIEHVGSTSVPALAAKPVIDIVLVVNADAMSAVIEEIISRPQAAQKH
jgi:GrpB protein